MDLMRQQQAAAPQQAPATPEFTPQEIQEAVMFLRAQKAQAAQAQQPPSLMG